MSHTGNSSARDVNNLTIMSNLNIIMMHKVYIYKM